MPIEKDVVLITSGGRTGTSFLGSVMDELVSDCWSTHEPDVWHGLFRRSSWRAVGSFGLYHVTLGKVLGRTGMRCVSQRFLRGDWHEERTAAAIIRQRREFYQKRNEALVVESNAQWSCLLPLLPRAFESYKVLALVRDPRSWVRSWMNYGGHHDSQDQVTRLGLPRLSPAMVEEQQADQWERMDTFERLCWDWQFITSRLLSAAETDSRVRLVRFEDLFLSRERIQHLDDVLTFLTQFPNRSYSYQIRSDIFARKVNASRAGRFGPWRDWPDDRRKFLKKMCGALMERVGYSLASEPTTSE